jgi:hypothetical protein
MGLHPTVVDWNNDGKQDLLVGDSFGGVRIYKNTNSITDPILDGGTLILNTGNDRATAIVDDWNGDGKKDLLVGNLTGTIQVYLNGGTDATPSFGSAYNLQVGGVDFDVNSGISSDTNGRSAPRIYDWDGDGNKDLLVGQLSGNIYYLRNTGENTAPVFNTVDKLLLGDGTPLRYLSDAIPPAVPAAGPRSRFDITDWNNDGYADIVVGGSDGKVMLFTAVAPEPLSTTLFIAGSVVLGLSRLRKKFKDKNK